MIILFWNKPEPEPGDGKQYHFQSGHFASHYFASHHFRIDDDGPEPPTPRNPLLGAGSSRFPDSITREDEILLDMVKQLAQDENLWLL